jgi:hypothetical protein
MRKFLVVCMAFLLSMSAFAAEDIRVDITNFEDLDRDGLIQMTGANTLFSVVDDPTIDGGEKLEGDYALTVQYAITNVWQSQRLEFGQAVDLTGMRELHFWVYFAEGSAMHHDGDYRLRIYGPHGHVFDEPRITQAGVWTEIVVPIDRQSSDHELSNFTHLNIIINPGSSNTDEGTMFIDDIFGFRPGNTPTTKEVLIFGFNNRDPETDAPVGWRVVDGSNGFIFMGDAIVEPSEGSDYLESVMPGGWVRPIECVNALTINDAPNFTEWDRVLEVMVDVQMSEGFSDGWHNFQLVINSSAGGSATYDIRSAANIGSWRTVMWDVDMTPYLPALEDPNGWLRFSFITQTGSGGSSVYIDNFRVGIPTTYVAANRSLDAISFQAGESVGVSLALEAEGDAQNYELIEVLPAGWSATNISDGGVFANGAITWTVNVGTGVSKSVSYTAVSPASASVDGAWDGSIGGLTT